MIKNIIYKNKRAGNIIMVLAILLTTAFSSCKKNNAAVDVSITVPDAAEFIPQNSVNRVSYYVNSAGTPYKVPVGITNVSTIDRTIGFTYTSRTALPGVQYSAPASIVIKAGTAIDFLPFTGLFSGFPAGRKDTVKVKFSGINGIAFKDSFELILQKYCDVVLTSLAGNYPNSKEYTSASATALNYGPYLTTIPTATLVSTGATTATGRITNLFDDGWLPITANFDWTDPANFKVTIVSQSVGKSYGGQPAFVKTSATPASTFSSCDNTITLRLDVTNAAGTLLTASTGAGSGYQIVLNR